MKAYGVRNRLLLVFCAALGATMLGACGSIPDLKSFADATNDIRSGVVAVGKEFSSSIPEDCKAGDANCRAKFDEAWKVRIAAMGAIADYSDSLAQVAAAGRDGAARAGEVVTSATTLLTALGGTLPGAVADVAKKGLAELAKARALRSMGDAIEAAHPPIKAVFEALDLDLTTLEKTSQEIALGMTALVEAEDTAQVGAKIEQAGTVATSVRSAIASDYNTLKVTVDNLVAVRSNPPKTPSDGCRTEAACVQMLQATDRRIAESRAQLAAIERDLESLNKAYAPIQAGKDAVRAQASRMRKTIIELRSGLDNWLAIHRSLAADVRRGLQPNVRQLVATAVEIQKLVDDMRKTP